MQHFAVWNTTMGSSLLAMSWGLGKTGLFPGILINIAIAALCLYTAYVLLNVNEKHGILGQNIEVPDLCRMLIGKWAEILAKIFSLIVLIGANIVYWILMSNFLFNSVLFLYGTISVGYLLLFVTVKFFSWGVNVPNWSSEFHLKPTFCALSGMLSLSYFIHNIIISIMRNNKHQENNGRDLTIAFGLITFTYIFIGVVFYISFPLLKTCIEDNILNNFSKRDTMTIIARVLFLFQLFTVFPLISFMLRNDILANMNMIFKNYRFGDFSYGRVVFINSIVLFICIMFACLLAQNRNFDKVRGH
ncbi:hypothetical protein NQ314_007083 [Rhamnusium bicolor]|uniref:Amino acid transporter transmembrane domain-containing protein n=1 Tax=Rhamnusium bicolor TaxID=1586634 RepID=A0AAV8YU94_9CUCU|nr:hypothetical protein NQ314_007083 [Rhamnusium bicolor]